jgi:hypothetical protein
VDWQHVKPGANINLTITRMMAQPPSGGSPMYRFFTYRCARFNTGN